MTSANLTKELRCSWEHQQQLIGDRASLDYILSCSNRINTNANSTFNHDELNSLLGRTARIGKVCHASDRETKKNLIFFTCLF